MRWCVVSAGLCAQDLSIDVFGSSSAVGGGAASKIRVQRRCRCATGAMVSRRHRYAPSGSGDLSWISGRVRTTSFSSGGCDCLRCDGKLCRSGTRPANSNCLATRCPRHLVRGDVAVRVRHSSCRDLGHLFCRGVLPRYWCVGGGAQDLHRCPLSTVSSPVPRVVACVFK
jgi:hypothetical protein